MKIRRKSNETQVIGRCERVTDKRIQFIDVRRLVTVTDILASDAGFLETVAYDPMPSGCLISFRVNIRFSTAGSLALERTPEVKTWNPSNCCPRECTLHR